MFTIVKFLLIFAVPACSWSTASRLEKKWIDASSAIPKTIERQIEKKYGLESACIGWNKQDGLIVPSFHFVCYRPMTLTQARVLYSELISKLSTYVNQYLVKKFQLGKAYERVPIDLMLSFANPRSNRHYPYPSMALISNGKGLVIYSSNDPATSDFTEIYREPEWNLVTWSDKYQPELIQKDTKGEKIGQR